MQYSVIDTIIKEVNAALSQLPSEKKTFYCARMAFSILKATLEEAKEAKSSVISSGDFTKFILELQDQTQPKAIFFSLSIISQIISFKLVNNVKDFEEVLEYLKFARTIQEDEAFQLRLSQLACSLIKSDFFEFHLPMYIEKCLFMLLYLRDSRNPIISSLANSHLDSIFETTCKNISKSNTSMDANVLTNIQKMTVSKFIVDLTFIVDGQRTNWYPLTSAIDRELGLRWANQLLLHARDLVFSVKDNMAILLFNLVPVLKKILNQYQPPIAPSFIVEIFRTFTRILEGNIEESIDLFDIFIKYIRHSDNSFCKTMSLECVIYFLRTQVVLKQLMLTNDLQDPKNCFLQLFSCLSEISRIVDPSQQELDSTTNTLMTQHLEGETTEEVPVSNYGLIVRLIADFQHLHSATLINYLHELKSLNQKDGRGKDAYRRFIRVIEHTGRYTHSSLSLLLSKDINECIVEICLASACKMIYLLGEVFNKQIQIEFIQMLQELAVPPKDNPKLTIKQLLVLKSILKLLANSGQQIDFQGWNRLLTALNDSHKFLASNRIVRQGTQEEVQKVQILGIVNQLYEDLFLKSCNYPDKMFITMVDAMNQITSVDLQSQAHVNSKVSAQLGIIKTLESNFFRIDIFWELVTAHFLTLSNSKFIALRENGASQLSELILLAFQYMAQYYKLKPLEEMKKEQDQQERKLKMLQDANNRRSEEVERLKLEVEAAKAFEQEKERQLELEKQQKEKQQSEKSNEDDHKQGSLIEQGKWGMNLQFEQLPEGFIEEVSQTESELIKQVDNQPPQTGDDQFTGEIEPAQKVQIQDQDFPESNIDQEIPIQSEQAVQQQQQNLFLDDQQQLVPESQSQQDIKVDVVEIEPPTQIQVVNPIECSPSNKVSGQLETTNGPLGTNQITNEVQECPKEEQKEVLVGKDQHTESKDESESQAFKRSFEKFIEVPQEQMMEHHLNEKEKWDQARWQGTIFQPWVQCLTIRYPETKQIIMDFVQRLLQSNGHQINPMGWESILCILYEVSQEQTSGFAKQGLKSVEYLINLYLSMIDQDKVPQIFEIIENFRKHSSKLFDYIPDDQSVNYEFCDMLWHFGDYLSKKAEQSQKVFYMNKIFSQLSTYCVEDNKEIRNQSLHIICNLMLHNSGNLGCEFWKQIFDQHFFPLMKTIINTQYEKLTNEDPDSQSWQTTCKSLIRACNKLFKRYIQLLDEEYPSYSYEELNKDDSSLSNPKFKKAVAINELARVFYGNMSTLLNQLTIQFHQEIIEAIKDLFSYKPYEIQLNPDELFDNLQYIRMVFTLVPASLVYTKTLLTHVIPLVLQYIIALIKQFYPWARVDQRRYVQEIVSLYVKILQYPSLVQQTHPSLRYKQDQQPYVKPIEALQILVINHPHLEYILAKLLQQVFSLTPTDVFNDYCIRHTTTRCIQFVLSKNQYRLELGLKVLKNMAQIMEHRWKSNYHRWFYALKKQQLQGQKEVEVPTPLWQFAYETFFELSVQILLQPPYPYHQIFDILLRNYDILSNTESIGLMATYLQDSQLKLFLALEIKSLQFLYKKFVHSPFAIVKVHQSFTNSAAGFEKIIQMSKDFSWVLFQLITPENDYIPKQKLIEGEHIDEVQYNDLNVAVQGFSYLVELVHYVETQQINLQQSTESDKHAIWIKYLAQRSRSVLPYLLAKVSIIIKLYVKQQTETDKTKQLEHLTSRVVKDELIETILQQLISLRIPSNSFDEKFEPDHQLNDLQSLRDTGNNLLLNGDCGHLFYLFPLLTKLIEIPTPISIKKVVRLYFEKVYGKFGFISR